MEKITDDVFVVSTTATGRTYVIHRRARVRRRCVWDVFCEGGGMYATFTTLPGARRWARAH